MTVATQAATQGLVTMNLLLLGGCLICLLGICGGVAWEIIARRRLRASLPKGWPPTPEKARSTRRETTSSPGAAARPSLPLDWPPVEEESKR